MNFLLLAAALISEIIGTVAGFGSSTLFLPVALFFLDFHTALVLVALFHIFGNLARFNFFRKDLDKALLLKFGLPSVALTAVGALIVSSVPQTVLKGLLGLFLAGYSSISFIKSQPKLKDTIPGNVAGGAVSGFLAGLIGTGGALRGLLLTSFGLTKERYIGTAAVIALLVDLTRIPIYLGQGFLKSDFYVYLPPLLLIAFAGAFIGKNIVRRIPKEKFNKVVLTGLLLIGVKFIWDAIRN